MNKGFCMDYETIMCLKTKGAKGHHNYIRGHAIRLPDIFLDVAWVKMGGGGEVLFNLFLHHPKLQI